MSELSTNNNINNNNNYSHISNGEVNDRLSSSSSVKSKTKKGNKRDRPSSSRSKGLCAPVITSEAAVAALSAFSESNSSVAVTNENNIDANDNQEPEDDQREPEDNQREPEEPEENQREPEEPENNQREPEDNQREPEIEHSQNEEQQPSVSVQNTTPVEERELNNSIESTEVKKGLSSYHGGFVTFLKGLNNISLYSNAGKLINDASLDNQNSEYEVITID